MAGTVTRYQCDWCGAYVTWRNTPDGRRAFAESNRRHDYHLRPVGDYHGRHRIEDGGISPSTFKAWDLWWALPAQNRPPHFIVYADEIAAELTLDVRRYLAAQGIDDEVSVVFDRDAIPEVYADATSLGTIPGAPYWVDGRLLFPYQRALPPGRTPPPIDWSQPIDDPEFEAWLRSVTPPPYP
ncbi:hypothetical protein J1770_gp80 [Gordonia phage EMoore]|uniref:Uncharacterized protein n=1 Tax=Gordonia phage EMoore TaxID=2656534 RepID=A0A649VV43_9CAUD|nr:hypothetical protein J1770_gp80 [Gordonia phage EMoore]QGJ95865.1 hypothetical protein SEA_EMOORE_80 [Gordonia phage EMoore]